MPAGSFPNCGQGSCGEAALSFSERCWAHLQDRDAWLASLPAAIKRLPAGPTPLNFKKVDARGLDFSHLDLGNSTFSQAHFSDTLFIGTTLVSSDMIGARLHTCDFVGGNLRNANFTRSTINHCSFSHADLRGAYLAEAQFKETDFMGAMLFHAVLWNADLSGARHLKKRSFADPDSPDRYAVGEGNAVVAYESYRLLKHYLHDKGLYEDGSWAAYRELTMERNHFFETRNPRAIPSLIMDLVSGYTEKPNRVILASFLIVLFFGVLYYFFNVPSAPSDVIAPSQASFLESLYFSFITFTTVGYGDLIPRPVIGFRLLACAEAFSGPFMAGLYIFTLTRRYAAS
jgi:hypothetical protein